MRIICGRRLFGRVDQVPGTCYVATRFFHLYYVPLIPLSSWIINQGAEKTFDFREQRIRLSVKSVVFGWLQAYFLLFGLLNAVWGGFQIAMQSHAANNTIDGEIKLILGLACLSAWLLFAFRPLRAGHERANELRAYLGIEPETHVEETEWS